MCEVEDKKNEDANQEMNKNEENADNFEENKGEKSNIDFKPEDIQIQDQSLSNNNNKDHYMSILDQENDKSVKFPEEKSQIQTINQNQTRSHNTLNNKENDIGKTKSNLNPTTDKALNASKLHTIKNTGTAHVLNNSVNLEISRTTQSMYKLYNIPAACEIEEYDFIFIDLDEFLNFHGTGLHLIELADFIKKIVISSKTPKFVINFPNILLNINIVNLELIDIILSIMSYTDFFLFDKKECLAFFNMLSQMNNEKELNEKNLFEHFQNEVPHIKSGISKIGLFLDELQKFTVIEQKAEKLVKKNDFWLNLHPKINHTNQKVIEDYRKIMMLNNSYLRSIFFGGYFSKYIFLEDHYPSFISGIESTKRILELFKNKIDFPADPEFYLVKLQKSKIDKDLVQENLRKKEEKFVLDCVNKKTASIKHYNPLFDDNLNAFFAGEIIRKQLKEKGFINTNGFVLYDASYKNIVPPKNVKKRIDTPEKEKRLLYAIKNNKVIFFKNAFYIFIISNSLKIIAKN